MSGARCWRALSLLWLAFVACSERAAPEVQRLALGFSADSGLQAGRSLLAGDSRLTLRPGAGPASFWVRSTLRAEDWRPFAHLAGVWVTARPFVGNGAARLRIDGQELRHASWHGGRPTAESVRPGYFGFSASSIVASLEAGAPAPGEVLYEEAVELGRSVAGANRVQLGEVAGEGFVVAPGLPVSVSCELTEPSELRFLCVPFGTPGPAPASLRVTLDGAELRTLPLRVEGNAQPTVQTLPLPGASGRSTLCFEFHGAPALCALLAPVIAPLRARAPSRADLVLFIADTFRADNLAAHGGRAEIAPHLNRFAATSAFFPWTWASAPWTLPSHVGMFTGLWPHESGVTRPAARLAEEVVTLAETFQLAGYRTAAITDGSFVSHHFGLDQGFEWFDGRRKGPDGTLAAVRAFLELEDARPAFLVVHSYRSHHPYRPDAEAAPETLRALGLRAELLRESLPGLPPNVAGWTPRWRPDAQEAQRMRDLEALYRSASGALDRLFGATRELLEARAAPAGRFVVFTSDHGEAFWEHGVVEHGNGVWEEHLRVPLLIQGPGLAPGPRETPASVIDLPRTLAGLAGVTPADGWGGADLFHAPELRTQLAFQCDLRGGASSLVLMRGGRKLVVPYTEGAEALSLQSAYDLRQDPRELEDQGRAPWAVELFEQQRDALQQSLRARFQAAQAAPSEEARRELRELGYGGD